MRYTTVRWRTTNKKHLTYSSYHIFMKKSRCTVTGMPGICLKKPAWNNRLDVSMPEVEGEQKKMVWEQGTVLVGQSVQKRECNKKSKVTADNTIYMLWKYIRTFLSYAHLVPTNQKTTWGRAKERQRKERKKVTHEEALLTAWQIGDHYSYLERGI